MFFGDAEVSKSHKNSNALGFRLKSVPLDIGCFFTAFQSLYQKNFQSLSDLFVVVNPFYTDLLKYTKSTELKWWISVVVIPRVSLPKVLLNPVSSGCVERQRRPHQVSVFVSHKAFPCVFAEHCIFRSDFFIN